MSKHIPVLLAEVLEKLPLKPGMTVVDATLGGGGYGKEIVKRLAPGGTYIGIDRDAEAIERAEHSAWVAEARLAGVTVQLVQKNFNGLQEIVSELGVESVDAVVADLGISSDQLEDAERGLSFLRNGPLDMRLDRSEKRTASEIVNEWSAEEIVRILRENAEESNAKWIAEAIIKKRTEKPIETTGELAEIVRGAVRPQYGKKKIHPATKTFMALRMTVNRERESLKEFLESALAVTRAGASIVIVTFHSGEDSLVKKFFRESAVGCVCPVSFPVCRCGQVPRVQLITRKALVPKEDELRDNPRSRSAKLRAVEKKCKGDSKKCKGGSKKAKVQSEGKTLRVLPLTPYPSSFIPPLTFLL